MENIVGKHSQNFDTIIFYICGVLGHILHCQGYTGPWIFWANQMNLIMKHAPGAGSIAQPIDQQFSVITEPQMPSFDITALWSNSAKKFRMKNNLKV